MAPVSKMLAKCKKPPDIL